MRNRVEKLANGFIRVDFRGCGLVGVYEVRCGGIYARSGSVKWLTADDALAVIKAATRWQ